RRRRHRQRRPVRPEAPLRTHREPGPPPQGAGQVSTPRRPPTARQDQPPRAPATLPSNRRTHIMTDTIPRPLNRPDQPHVSLPKFAPEPPVVVDERPSLEAVDRPDNPLAAWLTVPDVPILPPWARSAASLRANAVALGRLCAWHTRYHLLRTPKYAFRVAWRSEEHTSELQSRANLVCRLLLEKQKYKDEVTG